jgi:hypothetical protein
MLKLASVTALVLTTFTIAPLPLLSGAAYAQRCSTAAVANYPCNTPGGGSTYSCADQLGYLKRVYEEDLDAINDANLVAVVPVCAGEDFGMMRSEGNAGALRQIIASNDAMTEALFEKGDFGADDVIGVRMTGDEEVILYVHPFHR